MHAFRNTLVLVAFLGVACEPSGPADAGLVDAGGSTDAGSIDAGSIDAGSIDAGSADAGSADAGSADAGSIDAGSIDAGSIDAGSIDAGSIDAGSIDGGSIDAGSIDGGSADAGSTDAGVRDAGLVDAGARDAGVVDAGLRTLPLATFCALFPKRNCDLLVDCGYALPAARSACEATTAGDIALFCRDAQAGAPIYDGVAAASVFDIVDAGGCNVRRRFSSVLGVTGSFIAAFPDVTNAVFNRGAWCGGARCDAGTFCDNNCDQARCQPYATLGQSCQSSASQRAVTCAPGLTCDSVDGGPNSCLRRPTAGQPCLRFSCADGAYCDFATTQCQALRADGQACTEARQCVADVCGLTGTCGAGGLDAGCVDAAACAAPLACVGAAALADGGLTVGHCAPPLPLGATCEALPSRNLDPCGASSLAFRTTALCLDGRCRTIPTAHSLPAGAECLNVPRALVTDRYFGFGMCGPGLSCVRGAGVARCGRPDAGVGASCGWDSDCAEPNVCGSGVCVPRPTAGSACGNATPPLGLFCADVSDGGREYKPWLGLNATGCNSGESCENGLYCQPSAVFPDPNTCRAGISLGGMCRFGECAAAGTWTCFDGTCRAQSCL